MGQNHQPISQIESESSICHSNESEQDCAPKKAKTIFIATILLIILIITVVFAFESINLFGSKATIDEKITIQLNELEIPKIIWLYKAEGFELGEVETYLNKNNIEYFAQKSGFEVRFLTEEIFYEFTTKQLIEKISTMQNHRKVHPPFKWFAVLSVLIANGGVFIDFSELIAIQSFEWFDKIGEISNVHCLNENRENIQLLMFHTKLNAVQMLYKPYFIAAKKNSQLLQNLFDEMAKNVVEAGINLDFSQGIANILEMRTARNKKQQKLSDPICKCFGLVSLDSQIGPEKFNKTSRKLEFFNKNQRFLNKLTEKPKFLIKINELQVKQLTKEILSDSNNFKHVRSNSILAKYYYKIPANWKLLENKNSERKVEFCIVSAETVQTIQEVSQSVAELEKQNWKNWTAVYFVSQTTKKIMLKKSLIKKIHVINTNNNIGLNYNEAINMYCPVKSIVVLLEVFERLSNEKALNLIALKMSPKKNFGMAIGLNMNGVDEANFTMIANFNRVSYFVPEKTDFPEMKNIYNHLRVFDSNYYRLMPVQDLHFMQKFYENKLSFLIGVISLVGGAPNILSEKRHDDYFYFSRDLVEQKSPLILTTQRPMINPHEIKQIGAKSRYVQIGDTVNLGETFGTPFSRLFNASQRLTFAKRPRKITSDVIPKKIHQIWIGKDDLPLAKQVFVNTSLSLHPGYEYKLWRREDLTRQNFPYIYDLVQLVFQIDKSHQYSRISIVGDLMKLEIMYQHGGFYFDLNYQLLRPCLDDFRAYNTFLSAEQSSVSSLWQSFSFFGSIKNDYKFLRLLLRDKLNARNFYDRWSNIATGPHYFRKFLTLEEEYDPDNLILSFEKFYPYYKWTGDERFYFDKCVVSQIKNGSEEAFFNVGQDKFLKKSCKDQYPFSFGMDHYDFGGSWLKKRNLLFS